MARKALEGLDDMLFVLACAINDVEPDLKVPACPEQVQRNLEWLIEAARPLLGASERLRAGA